MKLSRTYQAISLIALSGCPENGVVGFGFVHKQSNSLTGGYHSGATSRINDASATAGIRARAGVMNARSRGASRTATQVNMATKEEIEELRAKAAKAREEAAQLAKELGKDPSTVAAPSKASATAVVAKPLSESDVMDRLSSKQLDFATADIAAAAAAQNEKLDDLVASGEFTAWKSASTGSANTQSPAPLRTFPVSLEFLSSRTNGVVTGETLGVGGEGDVSMDDFKVATGAVVLFSSVGAVASLSLLPENIGPALCYLFALLPILFIGIGSSAPGIIAGGIASLKGTSDDAERRDARVCAHEAGHFLCGYLCGLPVKRYSITDTGFPCVEFYPSADADANSDQGREFTPEEIAALSVVAMSGSVAEILQFGQARGGENDLIELNSLFRRSKDFIGAQKQQDLTRWGALAAYQLIRGNMDKYERLIQAFREKKSVAECIAAIESRS